MSKQKFGSIERLEDSVIETCSLAICLHEMGWDRVTYLATDEYCTDFSSDSLGLFLWYVLGH